MDKLKYVQHIYFDKFLCKGTLQISVWWNPNNTVAEVAEVVAACQKSQRLLPEAIYVGKSPTLTELFEEPSHG